MSDTAASGPPVQPDSVTAGTAGSPTSTSAQSGATLAAPEAVRSRPAMPKMFGIDIRFVPPMLITLILLMGEVTFHFLESWQKTVMAIGAAMLTELVLGRLFTGKWPLLASAYISGISVGILIRSPAIWPYLLCSAISITSKYVIRWRGRHLWNPSNFGICAMLVLAPFAVATLSIQWGNSLLPMIVVWVVGSLIIARLKRFHITITYVLSFFIFAFLRSAITHDSWQAEIAPITGPMYQLYIFFMITDPKSTVLTKSGQILVAFLIAAAECALRLCHHFVGTPVADELSVHAPYYALFIVGPIANVIEIARGSRTQSPPPAVARAA